MRATNRFDPLRPACVLVAFILSSSALAQQAWKVERPVEIITGSAAGNSIDRMARMVQRMLLEKKLVETPVMFHEYVAFAVRADSPIRDGKDLIAKLRKDPAAVSFALSSVLGGANHIATGIALKAGGVEVKKLRVVVFDSAGKAMTAMPGGHVES